jgi:hypothetical protein
MQTLPRSLFVRTVVIPVTFLAFLSGCYKWSAIEMTPSEVVAGEPDRARVVLLNGDRVELERMAIVDDSLLGYTPETTRKSGQRVAISLDDISNMETQKVNTTGYVLIGLGVAAFAVTALAIQEEKEPAPVLDICIPFAPGDC